MDTQFVRDRITQLRLKKGVSEYQMSYDLGHSRSYVYNISSGKSLPPMAEFLQICNYFDITPSQFFDESEENPALLQTAIEELRKLNDDDLMLIIGIWQSNDVYFVVIYYAIPAYYPELELQIVFLSGFNANHLYKAKSRKAWIIHRCLAVSLYLQMCYFREWSLTGQPTNIAILMSSTRIIK